MCDMCLYPDLPLTNFKFHVMKSWRLTPLWFWAAP